MDAYIVPRCDDTHPLYADFVEIRDWTESAWRTARDKRWQHLAGVSKGYIEVLP